MKPVAPHFLNTTCLAAMVLGLSAVMACPAHAVTDDGDVEAVILGDTPALAPIEELHFGDIVTSGAGTVEIDTAGVPSLVGGVSLVPSSPHQQAVMRVTGNAAAVVDINMVAPSYLVSNGTATMNVTGFDIGAGPGNVHAVTIGGGNTVDVNIGATLNVGAAQPTGNYTGAFTLNADYQ